MKLPFSFSGQVDREIPLPPAGFDRIIELEGRLVQYVRIYWVTVAAFVVAVFAIWHSSPRTPLVVGIAQNGSLIPMEVLSKEDLHTRFGMILSAFVREFLRDFTEYDSFQEPYRLSRAFRVMTPRLSKRLRADFREKGIVDRIEKARIRSRIEIRENTTRRISDGIYEVTVVTVRHVFSYDDPGSKRDEVLKCRLVVREGAPTSGNAYGLWVSSYAEHLLDRSQTGGKPQ
jgi:hypothetical protein